MEREWSEMLRARRASLVDELRAVDVLLMRAGIEAEVVAVSDEGPPMCGYCNSRHYGEYTHNWETAVVGSGVIPSEPESDLVEVPASEEEVSRETSLGPEPAFSQEQIEAYIKGTAKGPFGVVMKPGM